MKCSVCGCRDTPRNPVTKGADPYDSEIEGDWTEVWECEWCREQSSDEV